MRANERGSALFEALPASALIVAFALTALTIAYLGFTRVWLEYESEQGLYCLAERGSGVTCTRKLRERVERFVPWGEIERLKLVPGEDAWELELWWNWNGIRMRIHRRLSVASIAGKKASRW